MSRTENQNCQYFKIDINDISEFRCRRVNSVTYRFYKNLKYTKERIDKKFKKKNNNITW